MSASNYAKHCPIILKQDLSGCQCCTLLPVHHCDSCSRLHTVSVELTQIELLQAVEKLDGRAIYICLLHKEDQAYHHSRSKQAWLEGQKLSDRCTAGHMFPSITSARFSAELSQGGCWRLGGLYVEQEGQQHIKIWACPCMSWAECSSEARAHAHDNACAELFLDA